MGYSKLNRGIRSFIASIIALITIIAAFAGILYFKTANDKIDSEFVEPSECPDDIT